MTFHIGVFGDKEVYFIEQEDGSWTASCACRATNADIEIRLTAEQARKLIEREREWPGKQLTQDILADIAPQLREIFITGTTPAELDYGMLLRLRSKAHYAKLGYIFHSGLASPLPFGKRS